MMSPEDIRTLNDVLYGGLHGNDAGEEEVRGGQAGIEEATTTMATNTPAAPLSSQVPMICASCGQQVYDRYFLLAAGRVWHGACLRCSQCNGELQNDSSLYWRDGHIYCQQDYCRLFGIGRCARCSQPIPSSTLVMRSGELTFHPQCFYCQECDATLLPGNLYCIQGQNLYCQSHYHDGLSVPSSRDLLLQPCQREGEGEEAVSSPESQSDEQVQRRTKRSRTCFRREQLRVLELYFAQKHNPDGKDWTCLTHKTGLPKRVLQVWFQNARAKLKRSLSVEDPSDSASPCPESAAIASRSAESSSPSQPQPQHFSTCTIDQLELSLLTAPLSDPAIDQVQGSSDLFLGSPGCISPMAAYRDFEEGIGEGRDAVENIIMEILT